MALKIALLKVIDEDVLKKPMHFTVEGFKAQATIKDGVVVNVYPGVEDTNTLVTASKDGVTVECELEQTWLQNWYTTKNNSPKPGKN